MFVDRVDYEAKIRELEKVNRSLQKKLERSETELLQLEETNEKKESLLRKVIEELKDSQSALQKRSYELEQALQDLKHAQTLLMQTDQLVQTEKMLSLGKLVAGVAHEINNPINFIHGNLSYINEYTQDLVNLVMAYQQQYPNPSQVMQAKLEEIDLDFLIQDLPKTLNSMTVGTNRIREIVLSLRNFSRLDEAEFKVVDIHEGINSTLQILQHRLKGEADFPDIQVIKKYGQLPLIECYPGQLNQVFMNLLLNAIDALEECNAQRSSEEIAVNHPKTIWIQTQKKDANWVIITITDNGQGITEAIRSKIFDPFFTTKSVGKGTGLGLSISYQIVTQKHQGRLECETVLGQGTKFMIELPVRQTSPS